VMDNILQITKNDIVGEGKKLLDAGAKFVTAVCNDLDENLEVSYFFSTNRGIDLTCLRYTVGKDEEVPSLTGTTLSTLLIEKSGTIVLARAHVLITRFSFLPFIVETFVINAS
jgi:hypothetical protein